MLTENVGLKNDGPSKFHGVAMQDVKMMEHVAISETIFLECLWRQMYNE